MRALWQQLRTCWTLPDGTGEARALLLTRQLRTHFWIARGYAVTNMLTALALLAAVWPGPAGRGGSLRWLVIFSVAQIGWGVYAHCMLGKRHERPRVLARPAVLGSLLWCSITAVGWGVGLVAVSRQIDDPGMLLLFSASTTGIMSTGAMVGFSLPLLSLAWLLVLLGAGCLIVLGMGLQYQQVTLLLLGFYACVLFSAVLFTSWQFVRRFQATLDAEDGREKVRLLLGDLENTSRDWLWECDRRGCLTRVSARLAIVLGCDRRRLLGRDLAGLFSAQRLLVVESDHHVGVEALRARLDAGHAFSGVVVELGTPVDPSSWRISAHPLQTATGEWVGWRGVGCDVSDARLREAEAMRRERHLHHLAHHDALTGLPNRRSFLEASAGETPGRGRMAVALIDLDNFKAINDSLGHSTDDQVLRFVAERLKRAIDPGDLLARLGGDEFALLLRGLADDAVQDALRGRLIRIQEVLRQPEVMNGYRIDVRASIGATLVDTWPADVGEWLRQADIALYAARAEGRDTLSLYDPRMSERIEARLAQISDLSEAVGQGRLEVHYMAQHGVDDLRVQGYEALVRWRHPVYGQISPGDFIPVAESSGVIVPLGLWVLERACRDALAWRDPVMVAVNVSPAQLGAAGLVESVLDVLYRVGLPPHRLELEITESALARDPRMARGVIQQLRAAGMRIAMDDFGVGYSSMAQLRELPFDRIKLDQSFAAALLQPAARDMTVSIIRSIVQIARTSRMQVTAEGVETEAQLQVLRELGCDAVQGFLLGRPVPAAQVGQPGAGRAPQRRR
jgi:diguanylate cyclase (GGDEF)-like protein